ncbi:MAG: hypothetical protein IJ394_04955 [Bacteroidales bacterium]|nr:hypothetical protein [Bacteroidales bacterium]
MGIRLNISKFVESCSKNIVKYFSTMTLEKGSSLVCLIGGTVFLILALCGEWKYYVTMGLCYIAAFIVTEERER